MAVNSDVESIRCLDIKSAPMMNLLELAESIGVKGFLHCDELQTLVELAAGKDVLEVGAFQGLSAWGMAITAHSVFSVDTFRANSAGQQQMGSVQTYDAYLRAVTRYRNVKHYIGTSESAHAHAHPIDKNDESGPFIPHGQFDMIFIDAMHTYEEVKADIQRWYPRVKAGGIFACHDYGHHDFEGVKRAVDEVLGPMPNVVVTLGWRIK